MTVNQCVEGRFVPPKGSRRYKETVEIQVIKCHPYVAQVAL